MELEFVTKHMTTAMKSVKKMFDKGPFEADETGQDCLVATHNGGAVLEAAAGGLYVRASFPAEVKQEGQVMINRATLHGLKLIGNTSHLTHKPGANSMRFESGPVTGNLAVNEAFDDLEAQRPAKIPGLAFTLPATWLKSASKRVLLSTTLDTLLRMRLQIVDNKMTLSCNDAFRASAVRINVKESMPQDIEVPAAFFNAVVQSIDDEMIQIGFNDRIVRISGGGYDVCHPVLGEAEKPMADVFSVFERLKANEPLVHATMNIAAMKEAISAVSSISAGTGEKDVRLDMTFSDKSGTLTTAMNSSIGGAQHKQKVRNCQANTKLPITVNAKYVSELFNQIATDEADMHVWDRMIVVKAESVGCCMIIPQLETGDA